MANNNETYGWTAVPRSQPAFFSSHKPQEAKPVKVSELETPSGPVMRQVQEYAKKNLPEETYNHSMRVFYYGMNTPSSRPSPTTMLTTPPHQVKQ